MSGEIPIIRKRIEKLRIQLLLEWQRKCLLDSFDFGTLLHATSVDSWRDMKTVFAYMSWGISESSLCKVQVGNKFTSQI